MEIFINTIYKFLTNQENVAGKCSLIKRSEKLYDKSDFYFPINLKIWKRFEVLEPGISSEVNILNCKRKDLSNQEILEELIQLSQTWDVYLKKAEILNDKCFLYLDRQKMFSSLIPEILNHPENYGKEAKDELESVHLKLDNPGDLETVTECRTFLISNVLKNLLNYSKYSLSDNEETAKHKFLISTKSNKKKEEESLDSTKVILCGVVTDPKNGNKLAEISAEEYKKKRANDVNLMAQHKYGLRVKNEKIFVDLIQRLGTYAVTVDFLEIKVLSPVGLNYNFSGMGCSKGASFILYNSARLETLIDNFDGKVREGYYPALPEFKDIDISLLKEEVRLNFLNLSELKLISTLTSRKNGSCCSTTFSHFLISLNVASMIFWKVKFMLISFVHICLD